MHKVSKFGYLTLGVSDLDEAVDFYARIVRLELTERVGKVAFLSGGMDHHWVRLEEGSGNGVKRLGYEVVDDATLVEIRDRLKERGVDVEEGGDFRADRVQHWVRFVDPGGVEIDLYTGMADLPVGPIDNGVKIEKFLHAGSSVRNFDETSTFYQDVLGFKPSDWIGNMAGFFRCGDLYHHSLVLLRSPSNEPRFDHFCVQVESIDDVMRFRHNAVRHGAKLRNDVLRHAPSGSISVYVTDAARGFAVEYCTGHPRLDDEAHRPRVLAPTPETGDVWLSPLPEPSHRELSTAFDQAGPVKINEQVQSARPQERDRSA